MSGQYGPEFIQRLDPDLSRAGRHRRAHGRVAHPRGNLARDTSACLQIQNLAAVTPGSLVEPEALAVEWVPPILNQNRL
jgi:hypothetical protein